MKRLVRFDEPCIERRERRRCDRREQRRCSGLLACTEQCSEKRLASVRLLQVQWHADTGALEPAPQLLALNRDAAAIDLDDQTPRSVGGIELRLQRRIDSL